MSDKNIEGFACQPNCGTCCRIAGCDKLTADNTCSIYETRPDNCRSDKMYDMLKLKDMLKVDRKEFYKLSQELCAKLREIFK